jgi:alpha-tubulin suppressor-like RCC1 family protein
VGTDECFDRESVMLSKLSSLLLLTFLLLSFSCTFDPSGLGEITNNNNANNINNSNNINNLNNSNNTNNVSDFCGDGKVTAFEKCDEMDLQGQSCITLGYYYGDLACSSGCTFDESGCSGICGDSIIDSSAGEECDGSGFNNITCASMNERDPYRGLLTCTSDCKIDTSTCMKKGWIAVDSGEHFSCGILFDGTIWCWGINDEVQIGPNQDGTTSAFVPTKVTTTFSAVDISCGKNFVCAVSIAGEVWCWGSNDHYQLGSGDNVDTDTPQLVSGLTNVKRVSLGDNHSCAILHNGEVWCWGRNDHDQLGADSSDAETGSPVQIINLPSGVVDLSAGAVHTCVLTTLGEVWCWGEGGKGQLGYSSTTDTDTPVKVDASGVQFISISSGWEFTCGVTSLSGIMCWGLNDFGQLGDETTAQRDFPVNVLGMTGIVKVSGHHKRTCAIKNDGSTWCWGGNDFGSLGDGTRTDRNFPVEVKNAKDLLHIGNSSHWFSCGLDNTGAIFCWGNNTDGQLGYDSTNTDLKGAARILDTFRMLNCNDSTDNDNDTLIDTEDPDCIPYENSLFEVFNSGNPNDLINKKMILTPGLDFNSYTIVVEDSTGFGVVEGSGTVSMRNNFADDDLLFVENLGFDFPFYNNTYSHLYIGSDAKLSFEEGSLDWSESVTEFLNGPPMIAPMWNDWYHDLDDPLDDIYIDQFSNHIAITFIGIYDVSDSFFINFQVILRDTGVIEIYYGDSDNGDGVVGITPGRGARDTSSQNIFNLN